MPRSRRRAARRDGSRDVACRRAVRSPGAPRAVATRRCRHRPRPAHDPSPAHPNIVFVLTDDLSWDLVKYMPHVKALQQQGMTFDNYTVTDSLCCPSRASIFTGKFPHNTHVLGNTPADRRVLQVPRRGRRPQHLRDVAARRGLPHRLHGQVPQRLQPGAVPPADPRGRLRPVRATGLVDLGRRRRGRVRGYDYGVSRGQQASSTTDTRRPTS